MSLYPLLFIGLLVLFLWVSICSRTRILSWGLIIIVWS